MSSMPRTHNPRDPGTGQFVHRPYGRPPVSPYKLAMFTDENELDKGRVINDFHFRAKTVVQAELLFDRLVTQLTSGAETARPSLYRVGQVYRLNVSGEVLVMVTLVQEVGTRWHYRVALLDYPGAKTQLFQTQMIALNPVQVYRGYAEDEIDSDWPVGETKDRIAAA
jgi:hypothetical protein